MTHPPMTAARAPLALVPLLVLAALLATACSSGDPLQALLDDVVEAAEDRDADAIAGLLAADFRAGDGSDRDATVRMARQVFAAYQSLDAELSDVELNRRGPTGRARFRAKLSGVPTSFGGLGDLVPRSSAWDFDVTAREIDGEWKLATATWAPVTE